MFAIMVQEFPNMRKRFEYNPECDLHVVDGAIAGVDLRQAYINGVVPAGVSASTSEFNDVEDPSTLMNHPSDTFEAMRQSEHVRGALKKVVEVQSEVTTE